MHWFFPRKSPYPHKDRYFHIQLFYNTRFVRPISSILLIKSGRILCLVHTCTTAYFKTCVTHGVYAPVEDMLRQCPPGYYQELIDAAFQTGSAIGLAITVEHCPTPNTDLFRRYLKEGNLNDPCAFQVLCAFFENGVYSLDVYNDLLDLVFNNPCGLRVVVKYHPFITMDFIEKYLDKGQHTNSYAYLVMYELFYKMDFHDIPFAKDVEYYKPMVKALLMMGVDGYDYLMEVWGGIVSVSDAKLVLQSTISDKRCTASVRLVKHFPNNILSHLTSKEARMYKLLAGL